MVTHFKEPLNEVVAEGVDLLFCNEEELKIWADSENFEQACSKMTEIAKQFVITRGPNGAILFDGKEFISIAPNKVAAINTNGAGDMFAGAFLYGLTQGLDLRTAGKLSSLASAQVVTQFGPRLTPADHNAVKERILGN